MLRESWVTMRVVVPRSVAAGEVGGQVMQAQGVFGGGIGAGADAVDIEAHADILHRGQALMQVMRLEDEAQAPSNSWPSRPTLPSYIARRQPSRVSSVVLPEG